jgi:probable rRNA maturation factor
MSKIFFNSGDRPIPIKNRKKFKEHFSRLFAIEGYELQKISYIFCSDEYLLKLNKQFLNHNFYTDVLTFLNSTVNEPIESEIYISLERIKENAKFFEVSYKKELLRVMIHGALHLCGYNDKNKKTKGLMKKREDFYINLYKDLYEA